MFAKARLADLTIRELEQSRAAVLNTIASAQWRRGHQFAIERSIELYFGIHTLAEAQRKLGHQILDENLPYHPPLESPSPQQVFGAFVRDDVLRPSDPDTSVKTLTEQPDLLNMRGD